MAGGTVTPLHAGKNRTMEHLESQLTAAGTVLSDDVLDRIDEIVPARHHPQPGRQRLGQPGPGSIGAAPLNVTVAPDLGAGEPYST